VIEPRATALSAGAATPDGVVAEGVTASARDDDPLDAGAAVVLVGGEAVDGPPVAGDAQADRASTVPSASDTATRRVVSGDRTRGTG
jgi:hypothetical protein